MLKTAAAGLIIQRVVSTLKPLQNRSDVGLIFKFWIINVNYSGNI